MALFPESVAEPSHLISRPIQATLVVDLKDSHLTRAHVDDAARSRRLLRREHEVQRSESIFDGRSGSRHSTITDVVHEGVEGEPKRRLPARSQEDIPRRQGDNPLTDPSKAGSIPGGRLNVQPKRSIEIYANSTVTSE